MGLLDFLGFSKGSGEKTVGKLTAKLSNQNVQHEDRIWAAERLAELNTEEAILGLLKRYDMTLEKGYQDQDEKIFVRDLIVDKGEIALDPIRKFMRASDNVSWPERIASNILNDDEALVGLLLEVIHLEKDSGDMKGQKRARLVNLLIKYKDARIPAALLDFLKDYDESVRFTTVEVLDAQEDISARDALVDALVNPDEESLRVRRRILEALVRHQWDLGSRAADVTAWLPDGFVIQSNRIVER